MSSMHLYPMGKGDPLCPLGFHPQVRWPTRCKRCFRDYKEHGGKRRDPTELRKDDTTVSTPSLSSYNTGDNRRSWASSTNLAADKNDNRNSNSSNDISFKNPSSWTSTPDLANLEDDTHASIPTVSLTLPLRRKLIPIDTGQRTVSDSVVIKTPERPSSVFNKSDSLAARAKKMQASKTPSVILERPKRIQIKEVKTPIEEATNDVQYIIQVKPKTPKKEEPRKSDNSESDDDTISLSGSTTTESTTLVDPNEYDVKEQMRYLKQELETSKIKCERLEKEKSNILLRRLTAMDNSKGNSSEALKLQQKVNELQTQLDDYRDEKRSLNFKVKELENDLDARPTPEVAQKNVDELRSKLLAAETLCEELMDENEDMKKELRDLEDEIDEMQDNFREDQADEYTSLKKELEQTTKNCRILSFKLRKTERRTEQLETEKTEAEKKFKDISGGQSTLQYVEKIKQLEKDLSAANESTSSLQKKLDDAKVKLSKVDETVKFPMLPKRKAPSLGTLGKSASSDMKVSRESLTRGGSQDDPVQLLRDLQDSLEREADLREQLKFAEEEGQTLRKKASRVEDDNESLVLQLKKMATRTRPRKITPTRGLDDKKDEEDPADLKLQLELSEQETTVLRQKVEDLEGDNERMKKKTKDLQDKLIAKPLDRRGVFKIDNKNTAESEKIKVLENEMNEVRTKLIEKERDCERLEAEINVSKKRPKEMVRLKSLDIDQQAIDLKRQLQVIEQEAEVFRNKTQTLETENEKLLASNKRLELLRGTKILKTDKSLDIYIDKIATLEVDLSEANKKVKELEERPEPKPKVNGDLINTKQLKQIEKERDKLQAILEKLKENASSAFKSRKICAPTDLTTKLQLKTMVRDLENEIAAIMVTLGNLETSKNKLEEELSMTKSLKGNKEIANKELEELTKKIETMEKESKLTKTKLEELNKKLVTTNDEKTELNNEIKKMKQDQQKIAEEKKTVQDEVTKLKFEISTGNEAKKNLTEETQKHETLKKEMEKKESELTKLKDEINEKNKQVKELTLKTKKVIDLQKQIKEMEEDSKKSEKTNKDKIKQLENKLEEDERKIETGSKWNDKYDKLSLESKNLSLKIDELQSIIDTKNSAIEQLQNDLIKEKTNTSVVIKGVSSDSKEMKLLKEEIAKLKTEVSDFEAKYKKLEKSSKTVEEKLKKAETEFKTEKTSLDKKSADLELDLQSEKKKLQVMKGNLEKEQKNREMELGILKTKIKTLEMNSGSNIKHAELKLEYQDKIDKLESTLAKEKKEYETLTNKYEVLEEEHVGTKAKLVSEKEVLSSKLNLLKRELDDLEVEKDKYLLKVITLTDEKKELSNKLKTSTSNGNGNDLDRVRLKACLEERQSELDQLRKEYDVMNNQMEYMRRENDELKKKLDDFDKVNKVQRNISADSTAMNDEIKLLKAKLASIDKTKKSDLAQCKLRYESQISILNEEMKSLHSQVTRFKRERDTYKHMLEGAQKTIGDLKVNPGAKSGRESRASINSFDDIEEQKSKVATLEQQISCMEDELSESRLEGSKLKTELVSERSSWEVKMSEFQSRVNELEEEKILSSGRTKIAGLRTRMELSWQKEREEQQRLLQETATLARDLRQTLFEVERERDKEVLEAKRKMEQLKKTLDEDQDENKKKLNEMQCDFMELRDAHAKLRTTNEKLRREKERHEREREEMKFLINGKKRTELEDYRRINILVEQVENLLQVAPELFGAKERDPSTYTPTPPKRTKSKSREGSPSMERKDYSRESSIIRDDKRTQVQSTLLSLVETTNELKRFQKLSEDDRERERTKRQMGMRRATSTENDKLSSSVSNGRSTTKLSRNDSNLHRKSLSLEHTASLQDRNIWKGDDDSLTSLQSLDMGSDIDFMRSKRDASLDSRLSGGSTQSEISGEKKKKKGFMGKLKKLTKSRSIDDQDDDHFSPTRTLTSKPTSNSDLNEDTKGSKKDLKERITGMFRRAGSSSRSNSVERQLKHDTSSTQRPLMRNGSNSNLASKDSSTDKISKTRKNVKI